MEQNRSFGKILDKLEQAGGQLQDQMAAVRRYCHERDMKRAYEQTIRLEETAERMVFLTRALPAYTGCPHAHIEVENVMRLCVPVEIGFTGQGWFSMRIPVLLPKKEGGSVEYIRSIVYLAMRDFFWGREPVRYEDCVLVYRHVYDRERPDRQKRDHDNIETNMVSDIVAMYAMPDDGPLVCSHYACSAAGTRERTEVYVVPKDEFPDWIREEKNMPDEGVKLYEDERFRPENLM